jgi:hypothetical protein
MFNFNFGKKKTDRKQLLVLGLVLSSLIAALSQCTGVSENGLWDLLDEIQRKYFPQTILNELILQDPNQVKRRVERDVTKAIDDVTPKYDRIIEEADKKYKLKYIEKAPDGSEAQKLLGGEMRICAPWVEDCITDEKLP